jgi:hypothetical protein
MAEKRPYRLDRDGAEKLAISALQFLAGQPEELGRFLALAGIGPHQIRLAAAEPRFLLGIVDFMLSDEALLLAFSETSGLPPDSLARARHALEDVRPL